MPTLGAFTFTTLFNPYDNSMSYTLSPFFRIKILWVRKLTSQAREGFYLFFHMWEVRQYFSFLLQRNPTSERSEQEQGHGT